MTGCDASPPDRPEFEVPLTELTAEEKLLIFSASIKEVDSTEGVVLAAVLLAEEGVNIWRVIRENEHLAEAILGVDLPQPPSKQMVKKFDDIAEADQNRYFDSLASLAQEVDDE